MRERATTIFLLATALMAGIATAAAAQVGTFRDWSTYVHEDRDGRLCYIVSEPKGQEGSYSRRGKAAAFVSRLPTNPPRFEVNVQPGYTYKPGSVVEVTIDGRKFTLFTRDEHAWAREGEDATVIEAMRGGSRMTVRGTSTRDTYSLDTYSLLGFTAAYNAMVEACKDARPAAQRR
jgi:hypothetical protein